MPRGQKENWQMLRGVPKGRTAKPVRVAPCIWVDCGVFHVYRYRGGKSLFVGSFETLKEALKARDSEAPPTPKAAAKTTVAEYFQTIFLLEDQAERKPSTIRAMRSRFNAHINDTLGNRKLGEVTLDDLTWFAAALVRKKTGAKTRRETLLLVRAIFASALAHKKIAASPAESLKVPSAPKQRVRIPPLADARAVIDAIEHRVPRLAAELMLQAGLRVGEVLALKWSDVDLAAGKISVSRSVDHCTRTVHSPKTPTAVRDVPLAPQVKAALRAYYEDTPHAADDAWLFPAIDEGRADSDALAYEDFMRLHWNPAKRRRGIQIHPHALRHLFASRLLQKGTPAPTAAKLLGHASAVVTLSVYAHVLDDDAQMAQYVAAAFA